MVYLGQNLGSKKRLSLLTAFFVFLKYKKRTSYLRNISEIIYFTRLLLQDFLQFYCIGKKRKQRGSEAKLLLHNKYI